MFPKAPHVKGLIYKVALLKSAGNWQVAHVSQGLQNSVSFLLSLLLPGQWVSLALPLATAMMYCLARGQGNGITQSPAGTFQTVSSNKPFVYVS